MKKKAVITVELVPESVEASNTEIEREIRDESSIPWVKEIERVTIIEQQE